MGANASSDGGFGPPPVASGMRAFTYFHHCKSGLRGRGLFRRIARLAYPDGRHEPAVTGLVSSGGYFSRAEGAAFRFQNDW